MINRTSQNWHIFFSVYNTEPLTLTIAGNLKDNFFIEAWQPNFFYIKSVLNKVRKGTSKSEFLKLNYSPLGAPDKIFDAIFRISMVNLYR